MLYQLADITADIYIFFQELSLFKDKQTKNSNDNDIISN